MCDLQQLDSTKSEQEKPAAHATAPAYSLHQRIATGIHCTSALQQAFIAPAHCTRHSLHQRIATGIHCTSALHQRIHCTRWATPSLQISHRPPIFLSQPRTPHSLKTSSDGCKHTVRRLHSQTAARTRCLAQSLSAVRCRSKRAKRLTRVEQALSVGEQFASPGHSVVTVR